MEERKELTTSTYKHPSLKHGISSLAKAMKSLEEYLIGKKIEGEVVRVEKDSVNVEKVFYLFYNATWYHGRRELDIVLSTRSEELPVKIVLLECGIIEDEVLYRLHKRNLSYGSVVYGRMRTKEQPYSMVEPKITTKGEK